MEKRKRIIVLISSIILVILVILTIILAIIKKKEKTPIEENGKLKLVMTLDVKETRLSNIRWVSSPPGVAHTLLSGIKLDLA